MTTVTIETTADTLDAIRERIKSRNRNHRIETGRDLLKAKDLCAHGTFGTWLHENFKWSETTAQTFMNSARQVDREPALAVLPPSALGALAAPNTPESVKTEVVAEIDAGKIPTAKDVKTKIAAAKAAAAQPTGSRNSATVSSLPPKSTGPSSDGANVEDDLVKRLKAAGLDAASKAFHAAYLGYTIFSDDDLKSDLKAA